METAGGARYRRIEGGPSFAGFPISALGRFRNMKSAILGILIALVAVCGLAVHPAAGQEGAGAGAPQESSDPMNQTAGYSPLDTSQEMAPVDLGTYNIGPEDVLQVRVWREPEVSAAPTVRPDGMISLPLIGEVRAGGLTPTELGEAITEKLSEFLNRPEVFVAVQQVRSKKYYLTGQVNRTGAFPLLVPTTVLEALSASGGFQQWANRKNITILRGTERFKFNYNEVIKGKHPEQNIYLENGDHIIVP